MQLGKIHYSPFRSFGAGSGESCVILRVESVDLLEHEIRRISSRMLMHLVIV